MVRPTSWFSVQVLILSLILLPYLSSPLPFSFSLPGVWFESGHTDRSSPPQKEVSTCDFLSVFCDIPLSPCPVPTRLEVTILVPGTEHRLVVGNTLSSPPNVRDVVSVNDVPRPQVEYGVQIEWGFDS